MVHLWFSAMCMLGTTASSNNAPFLPSADADPTLELECALAKLAIEFSRTKYTNDPDGVAKALHTALHLDLCPNATSPPPYQGSRSAWRPRQQPRYVPAAGPATQFFVSPLGSDGNEGSLAKPFATILRARNEIRKTPITKRGSVTVQLRAGTYYLAADGGGGTLEFTEQDSGPDASRPVRYAAYKDELVTISGGVSLPLHWKPYTTTAIEAKGAVAYQAQLPAGVSANFTSLFVDGEPAIRARWVGSKCSQCRFHVLDPDSPDTLRVA
jgi:hypothetical protein